MYKIHYLPLALNDLKDKLEAPQAAENLLLKINKEVLKIAENPFLCHLYVSSEKMKYEYRVLHVNNYSLFYVVENAKIEIHRVIYSRRDTLHALKEKAT